MRFAILIVLFLIIPSLAQASETNPFAVGVHTIARMSSYSCDQPAETHAMTFSGMPDIGLSAYIPLHKKNLIGLTIDAALANYKNSYTSSAADITRTFKFLTITPGVSFDYATLGVAIGLPMGYSRMNNVTGSEEDESWGVLNSSGKPEVITKNGKDFVNMMIEPRLGIAYPIMKDVHGSRLNVNAHIGYMMTNLFKEGYYPTSNTEKSNGSMLSIGLGVQYYFAL